MMKAILKKCIILFTLILSFTGLAVADLYGPYTLHEGSNIGFQVIDGITGNPLSNVTIEYSAGPGFVSESGRFYIIGDRLGTFRCTVKKVGYTLVTFFVEVVELPARSLLFNSGLIQIKLYPSAMSRVEVGCVAGEDSLVAMTFRMNFEVVLKEAS